MNPPHPFLHHRRQTPSSDTTIDTSITQSSTDNKNNSDSNSNNNSSSFYHPHHSSASSIYLTPIVADRTLLTDPRTTSASTSSEQQQYHPSSTPSLPYTTTITPLFRPTPPPTYNGVSAIKIATATFSAITASSAEAAAVAPTSNTNNAVRKSSPSPACEACMASTSESGRQRAASPRSTRPASPQHRRQQGTATTRSSVITPEFDIVHHSIRDTVWIVSALLSLMAHKNDGQYNPLVDPITPFHSRAVPRISIEAYLTRILQFIPFTNEVLLNVLVFLDRIGGLGGMENEIVELMEGFGTGRDSDSAGGSSSNRVDGSLQKNGLAADAIVASSSSHPRSLSSHPSTTSPSDTITSSSPFPTGTATASATPITTTSVTALPGSTSGQAQSSRCHTCRHNQRARSMSSSSSTCSSRVESSCGRSSSSTSASKEADPDSFPPSSASPAFPSSSSATSCIHPISNNNNSNNNTLNSDPPMVLKRGREAEIHEHEQQRVGGGCAGYAAGGSKDPSESSTSSLSSFPTSPSSFSSSSTATTPLRAATTHQHPPPAFHNSDSNRDAERLAKRARFQDPVATERLITSSTTVDAHSTPGGATPAPTPKMTAAPNGFRVNSFNIHRLLITCLMVAAKFTSDLFYSNARYAKVGGLSLPELNQLELVFLFTTQFDLNVKEEELQRVGNALLRFKNRETNTSNSQVSLPAPPAAIAAQVARTVVVVNNNTIHPNTNNTIANTNAVHSDGNHVLRANTTASTESSEMIVDPRQQPPRASRFSIPSPTSPKSGPMSDRGFPQKPISSLPSSSTSSSSSSSSNSTVSSTTTATLHAVSSSAGHSTTVVASGSRSQPPQLLSPPEEKCGGWTEGGTGGDSRDVHMATPAPTPSALSSSMPTEPN